MSIDELLLAPPDDLPVNQQAARQCRTGPKLLVQVRLTETLASEPGTAIVRLAPLDYCTLAVTGRHGAISAGKDIVPLPSGVKCYAAAAVRAAKRSLLSERLIGDGLVTLDSALGRHRDRARMLPIPTNRQWVGYGMGHRELLNHPDAYRQISTWLQEPG